MATRSYGQYCGLARALDVVGDRWNLLIVRELLMGPARYGELAGALPGIATNLLAGRLRSLVDAGVVERTLDEQRNGAVYRLTAWGEQLRETIDSLIRWSTPLMVPGPEEDTFRPEWLGIALRALLRDERAEPAVVVGLETAGAVITVRLDSHGPHVAIDEGSPPATVLRAEPGTVLGLAAGVLTVEEALGSGTLQGDARELHRMFRRS